ncbi:MAG: hypothetical protein GWN53_17365 [Gammaproteobacteria bacterium]|uniref:Uncharacterized protein n=1 Tax=Candidatus Kutchimonas denitrificans TaxID=3056748 RepID=A0AAE5CDY9_9BACT|nr:hypothetical protein [Candidatus Kutchimonas denitrificans]NIV53612.1 hypothetical protein [Gammaproteobacteria bacterium]
MKTLALALTFVVLSCTVTPRSIYSTRPVGAPDLTLRVINNTAQPIHVYLWPSREPIGVADLPDNCLTVNYVSPYATGFVFEMDGHYYTTPNAPLSKGGWETTINSAPANWQHDVNRTTPAERCDWR